MKYPHLWNRLYNAPLAIDMEKAVVIEEVFRARVLGAVSPRPRAMDDDEGGAPKPAAFTFQGREKPYYMTQGRVALIPIVGTLIQRGDWMDAMSGLQSYGSIASLVSAAAADPDVAGMLLEIDSPGGEVFGLADLASLVRAAAEHKPVWAAANEQAFSAAMWLLTSAGKAYAPKSGLVGSIGTIALHVNQSKADAQRGYEYTAIFAGKHKNDFTSHAPLSEGGRKRIQEEVDRHYAMFTGAVAGYRGIPEDRVRGTEASILDPHKAHELGLIDGVASIGEVLAMLEAQVAANGTRSRFGAAAPTSTTHKETHMQVEQQQNGGAGTSGSADAKQPPAQDSATIAADARKAERGRIAAILGSDEAKGRATLAQHIAHETEMNVDDAKKMLAAAPKESAEAANPLAAAMAGVKNPKVGVDGAEITSASQPVIDAGAIFAARRKAAGH